MNVCEWKDYEVWSEYLQKVIDMRPFSETNIPGVQQASVFIEKLLVDRGFSIQRIANTEGGSDILVAKRYPQNITIQNWIGICGHFDVEVSPNNSHKDWIGKNPFNLNVHNGRVYLRGVGDNLGPLLLRILALGSNDQNLPGIVWFLHGEEEICSPFAHKKYPELMKCIPEVKRIVLYLDETGYFLSDGRQRVLVNHFSSNPAMMKTILDDLRKSYPLEPKVVHRYLNKAFGGDKCPCIQHIFSETIPYLAVGPNDVSTNIHGVNESIPMEYLKLSQKQFKIVLEAVANF